MLIILNGVSGCNSKDGVKRVYGGRQNITGNPSFIHFIFIQRRAKEESAKLIYLAVLYKNMIILYSAFVRICI